MHLLSKTNGLSYRCYIYIYTYIGRWFGRGGPQHGPPQ